MYTEEDLSKLGLSVTGETEEDSKAKSLDWLLEMDLTEPEESLFTVVGNEYHDSGLSAFEAEVAARPLIRGNNQGDDLANYVDEEIVISSESVIDDIYTGRGKSVKEESRETRNNGFMAVDFSAGRQSADDAARNRVDEGTDILGLASEDDIGEKYVAIKRVRRAATGSTTGRDSAAPEGEVPPPTGTLTGAPVPTQVADPARDDVANDSNKTGTFETGSVLDYVGSIPEPEDDDEFDKYLLAGGHLSDVIPDPEELVLEPSAQGIEGIDTTEDSPIDYHDDFLALEGFSASAPSAVAPVIGPVMEEISAAVQARLEELGMDAHAVSVDVRLGADEETIKQCYAEGYQPVHAVCLELPEPLVHLEQAARDIIYVRLLNTVSNETCNDLFSADFEYPEVATGSGSTSERVEPETEWSLDEGFGEDIFGDDFNEDFAAQLDANGCSGAVDIEEAFSELSHLDGDADDIGAIATVEGQDASAVAPEPEQAPVVEEPVVEEQTASVAAFNNAYPDNFIPDYINFNYSSQSNAEIFSDFLDAFIEEGSVEVEKLENEVHEWEKSIASDALFANVCRTLHTVKGIAKGVGLQRLGTLVHNFETLLEKMPRPAEGLEQDYFRIVNAWLDALVRGVEHVSNCRADIDSELPVPAKAEISTIDVAPATPEADTAGETNATRESFDDTALVAETAEQAGREALEIASRQFVADQPRLSAISALDKKRDKQLADEGAKVLAAQQSVRITSEKLDHLLNLTSQVQQLGVRASQNTSRGKRSSAELQARLSSIRTHIRKIADRALLNVNARPGRTTPDLDALEMDQYSELQEAASILREGVEDLADLVDVLSRQNAQVETLLKQQSSVISSISSSIQGARVVPVSRLMPGLRRIVRTVSTDLGKVVSFQVLNETGALDRDHYARLQIILEHMVRNALDHGIESPDERVAMGKPTGGRITVDVRKSGGDYVIRLSDDGRGIDPDAIRQSAYEKGLDMDIDALSDDEAMRLIFHKGFSTANTLSEISGRGVGMDIVMTELQQIGGEVQIQSALGIGTAFEVRIPSSVTVNGALLVAAGGESYAIPLNGLVAVEQVPVEEFFAAVEQRSALSVSAMECEPTYLATLCQGVPLPDRSAWNTFVPVIVAGSEDRYMAIAIDNLEEALELVVRSLGSQFSAVPGVAGAATTAEGEAVVALDLNLLVRSAGEDSIAPVAVSQTKAEAPLALVVDDSRTQRMVATSQLDTVGVETITAENGLVAIDLLNATHRLPDIILLDVEMPVKDGIETLREIRKSRRYGHLPVIMVTSRTGAKHRALASEAGCNAYMGKPFNFAALIKQINELTGHDLQLSRG